jgi:hypothetical protein
VGDNATRRQRKIRLLNLYSSLNIVSVKKQESLGSNMIEREITNSHKDLVGNPEENRPLANLRHFSVDGRIILKSDIKSMDYDDVDWINLAQERYQW